MVKLKMYRKKLNRFLDEHAGHLIGEDGNIWCGNCFVEFITKGKDKGKVKKLKKVI